MEKKGKNLVLCLNSSLSFNQNFSIEQQQKLNKTKEEKGINSLCC